MLRFITRNIASCFALRFFVALGTVFCDYSYTFCNIVFSNVYNGYES